MTTDQISKLPPELRPATEYLERVKLNDLGFGHWQHLDAALTWGLQVVEEKEGFRIVAQLLGVQLVGKQDELRTAEATIATLTRERDEWRRMSLALVTLLRAKCSEKEWCELAPIFSTVLYLSGAALSHTPEGKK